MITQNIKINDTIINDANVTLSENNLLGIKYHTTMSLLDLVKFFDANLAPEIVFLDKDNLPVSIYKNRKMTSLDVKDINNQRVATIGLQVSPIEFSEADILNEKINNQNVRITAQDDIIASQAARIEEQETEIINLKNSLSAAETEIVESKDTIAEMQMNNDMLTECVLELSMLVYA